MSSSFALLKRAPKHDSALQVVLCIGVIIFLVEAFVMGSLAQWDLTLSVLQEALLDSTLLTVLGSPLIYYFVISPFETRAKSAEAAAMDAVAVKEAQADRLSATLQRFDLHRRILDDHAMVIETDANGIITYVNRAVCFLTGYSQQELIGRSHEIISNNRKPDSLWQAMSEAVDSDGVLQKETSNKRKDGSAFWALTTIAVSRREDQSVTGYISIGTDITQNKHREAILRSTHDELIEARERAVDASLAKSQFLTNMSHEIRTPMNGVFGMTDLLSRTALDARQSKLVSTIQDSAKSLLTIINDILDLSRIEAGKLELDFHDFNLRDGLERTIDLFTSAAQAKALELTIFVAGDVPGCVNGDQGRLKQVCTNLLGNAIKFTKSGDVSLRVTRVDGDDIASRVKFEISDTGIGVDPATRKRLFQPFTQAESSISRRYGGTGLGLSISRHLVEMMGGEIEMQSELGKGSTVSFVINMKHAEANGSQQRPDYRALKGARILVIDDRETNRDIINSYLEDCGAHVTAVESTALAWPLLTAAACEKRPYHAAVVDMLMPDENGIEFAKRIKASPTLASLKIVLATSMSWEGDLASIRATGIESVLTKPIRRHSLLDEVSRAAAGARHQGWKSGNTNPSGQTPDQASSTPQRKLAAHVLLVEDNPVNIEVAKEYLASLGCTVRIAVNGREAVDFAVQDKYDIILMDCQMPVMDGLEATSRIRASEIARGAKRLPIIAVTANAFTADRLQCIEAGMDGHLSKPFPQAELEAVLTQWLPQTGIPTRKATPGQSRNAAKPQSKKSAKARAKSHVIVEGVDSARQGSLSGLVANGRIDRPMLQQMQCSHPALFKTMIKTFLRYTPDALTQLASAQAAYDTHALRQEAHGLKSSSANVGALEVARQCHTLETVIGAGHDTQWEQCSALVATIENELLEATKELKQILAQAVRKAPGAAPQNKRNAGKG
ncbi:MAG: response regulator [Hyphomicrobium sp.]